MSLEFLTEPNVVVNALAGTGKTTTIKQAVKCLHWLNQDSWFKPTDEQSAIIQSVNLINAPGKVHMTSFSTDAADQLAVGLPEGVTSSSTYGMGLRYAKRHGMAQKVDRGDWKYGRLLTEYMSKHWEAEDRWPGLRMNQIELCKKARLELHREMTWEQINDLADHYGIDIPGNLMAQEIMVGSINHMLRRGLEEKDEFDYVDMVYIPNMEYIVEKQYMHLFVDEYQDMGKAQQEMCYRSARRIIAIGDPNQAIYGFIGADANATQSFCTALGMRRQGVIEHPLTYTRRCAHAIVAEANRVLDTGLKALPEAPEGVVKKMSCAEFDPKTELTPRDMLICPTNAPLISLMFRLSKLGIKAYIQKSDIVDRMIAYVKRHHTKGIDELRKSIDKILEQTQGKTTKKANAQRDQYGSMKEIADSCLSTEDVIRSINGMFSNDKIPNAIRLSTVHRSKGLEAERIIFWEENLVGNMASLAWEKKQAINLKYVGITRAMKELYLCRAV